MEQHDRARAQKNTLQPHRRQHWVIPPKANSAFVAAMEDVLAVSRQWLRLAEQAEETGRIESPPTSAGRMPLREPQPTSVNTSAINSRRDIFDSLEREIECFKNSVQPPSQESLAPSGAQD
jgi:hypothetical protein